MLSFRGDGGSGDVEDDDGELSVEYVARAVLAGFADAFHGGDEDGLDDDELPVGCAAHVVLVGCDGVEHGGDGASRDGGVAHDEHVDDVDGRDGVGRRDDGASRDGVSRDGGDDGVSRDGV